jgi:hypothetical protein
MRRGAPIMIEKDAVKRGRARIEREESAFFRVHLRPI